MKNNKVVIGVVAGVAAIIFLPVTKILVVGGIATAGYYGFKHLTK